MKRRQLIATWSYVLLGCLAQTAIATVFDTWLWILSAILFWGTVRDVTRWIDKLTEG